MDQAPGSSADQNLTVSASFPIPGSIPPLSEQFVCPHCGGLDVGTFCSSCAGPLRISTSDISHAIITRLRAIGYLLPNELAEKARSHRLNHDLPFDRLGGATSPLISSSWGEKGRVYEIVIIHGDSVEEIESVSDKAREFLEAFVNPPESNGPPHVEKLSIRNVFVTAPSGSDECAATAERSPGFISGKLKAKEITLHWSCEIFSHNTGIRISRNSSRFDVLAHQIRMAVLQSVDPAQAPASRQAPGPLRLFYAIAGEFIGYAQMLLLYTRNRYLVADLVINRELLSREKIAVLYIVGIPISITLVYCLTLGKVRPDQLLLLSALPSPLDEFAEFAIDLVVIGLQAGALALVLRIMRQRTPWTRLFFGFLFVEALFQVIGRGVDHFSGALIGQSISDAVSGGSRMNRQPNDLLQYAGIAYSALYLWFLYPMVYAICRTDPKRSKRAINFSLAIVAIPVIAVMLLASMYDYSVQKEAVEKMMRFEDRLNNSGEQFQSALTRILLGADVSSTLETAISRQDSLISEIALAQKSTAKPLRAFVLQLHKAASVQRDLFVIALRCQRDSIVCDSLPEQLIRYNTAIDSLNHIVPSE